MLVDSVSFWKREGGWLAYFGPGNGGLPVDLLFLEASEGVASIMLLSNEFC